MNVGICEHDKTVTKDSEGPPPTQAEAEAQLTQTLTLVGELSKCCISQSPEAACNADYDSWASNGQKPLLVSTYHGMNPHLYYYGQENTLWSNFDCSDVSDRTETCQRSGPPLRSDVAGLSWGTQVLNYCGATSLPRQRRPAASWT